jgi:hypothetical protein
LFTGSEARSASAREQQTKRTPLSLPFRKGEYHFSGEGITGNKSNIKNPPHPPKLKKEDYNKKSFENF